MFGEWEGNWWLIRGQQPCVGGKVRILRIAIQPKSDFLIYTEDVYINAACESPFSFSWREFVLPAEISVGGREGEAQVKKALAMCTSRRLELGHTGLVEESFGA
jgi:hypothetical protein